MLHYATDAAPPCEATLRLYTYRPHCALVGRYQSLEAELDTHACARLEIEIGRRPTGGGAIIMGPQQLGVAITTRAPAGIGARDLMQEYGGGILHGLASLGVGARFRGKNDLEVGGRKIAGLGIYADDAGGLLFHGSVLAGLDVALMLEVLRIPGAKLAGKGIARVDERLTTVSRELGREVDGADVREAIAEGFRSTLGIELAGSRLDEQESARARVLAARYASQEWLAGRQVDGEAGGVAMLGTPSGLIRVYAGVQGTTLSSVMLAGDYSAPPPSLLGLEAALRWCRADRARIFELTRRELRDGELGVGAEKVAAAIWEAAQAALGTALPAASAPEREARGDVRA
jgi:lipoate-protein ligase A